MVKNAEHNPCFSCNFQMPGEQEIRQAACCFGPVLTMSVHCFIKYFQNREGIGRVWFVQDEFMGEQVMVEIPEGQSCVHLIKQGMRKGLCGIEVETGSKREKPHVCQEVIPLVDTFCAKTKGGRLAGALISSESTVLDTTSDR